MTAVAPILQAFFTDRLITQRCASPHTIAGYRDTFRLLIGYAATKTGKKPFVLDIDDLDAPTITAFLDHLEHDRGNQPRTRNWRLAAIHSLFSYAALHHPEHAATIHRVLAIPPKRYQRNVVNWLTEDEADALLAAPDRSTWTGRRDHTLLVLAIQTGLRISELIGLNRADVNLGVGAHVHCVGKGRKQRATPLPPSPSTCCAAGSPNEPVTRTSRCSQPEPARDPAGTRSNTGSPATPMPQAHPVPRYGRNTSPCTPCATPPPCDCCTPASTSP